jgi:hypothetical protein
MSEGQIQGPDFSMCACCGGWFISIDNDRYRFYELSEESDLDLENETFPITVRLNWRKREHQCLGDEIIVEAIERK